LEESGKIGNWQSPIENVYVVFSNCQFPIAECRLEEQANWQLAIANRKCLRSFQLPSADWKSRGKSAIGNRQSKMFM
ncbi:MAG TPA: hypothetical protein VKB02_15070, partial [Pyrinomonadaceae bacterium]|nr:hypothetical protein [Pyrinomonadaceae bacterium]